jgi:hypothetical protein
MKYGIKNDNKLKERMMECKSDYYLKEAIPTLINLEIIPAKTYKIYKGKVVNAVILSTFEFCKYSRKYRLAFS